MDMMEAPEPLLAFYCQYHYLHQVPVARELSPTQLNKVLLYCCSVCVGGGGEGVCVGGGEGVRVCVWGEGRV